MLLNSVSKKRKKTNDQFKFYRGFKGLTPKGNGESPVIFIGILGRDEG